jgi:hypothetical protein
MTGGSATAGTPWPATAAGDSARAVDAAAADVAGAVLRCGAVGVAAEGRWSSAAGSPLTAQAPPLGKVAVATATAAAAGSTVDAADAAMGCGASLPASVISLSEVVAATATAAASDSTAAAVDAAAAAAVDADVAAAAAVDAVDAAEGCGASVPASVLSLSWGVVAATAGSV